MASQRDDRNDLGFFLSSLGSVCAYVCGIMYEITNQTDPSWTWIWVAHREAQIQLARAAGMVE